METDRLKQRPGDQPLPIKNNSDDIQSMVIFDLDTNKNYCVTKAMVEMSEAVIADVEARRLVGIERYGTALQAHNGRNALQDAYEEALDLMCYLKQCSVEGLPVVLQYQQARSVCISLKRMILHGNSGGISVKGP